MVMMGKRKDKNILDHLRSAENHLQEAQHLLYEGGPNRPKRFRMKLKEAKDIVARLHVKEVQYINRCLERMKEASDYSQVEDLDAKRLLSTSESDVDDVDVG